MSNDAHHVGFLDGFRGCAALWVIVGHAMLLTGFKVPLVALPDLAVDLFILISGFLMTFNYIAREDREPWQEPDTWLRFWTRRFFRIAPLYYVVFAVAMLLGPWLGEARHAIAAIVPNSGTEDGRYFDQSLGNILMHVSFLFGLLPAYHYRSALPDWSIGLEMQYYAAFPFLMLAVAAWGWLRAGALIALAGILGALALHHYGVQFSQPALLVLKLHMFLAGMVLAASHRAPPRRLPFYGVATLLLAVLPIGNSPDIKHTLVRFLLAALFFAMLHRRSFGASMRAPLDRVAAWFGGRVGHWLGEFSYGAYLIHLLVLVPVLAWLCKADPGMSAVLRFGIGLAVTLPITYGLAALGHVALERPGIALGRRLLSRRRTEPLRAG